MADDFRVARYAGTVQLGLAGEVFAIARVVVWLFGRYFLSTVRIDIAKELFSLGHEAQGGGSDGR